MNQLNIKQMTKEELVANYNLTEKQAISYLAKGYPINELEQLMSQATGGKILMIENRLYKESELLQEIDVKEQQINQEEVIKIEQLNDQFRDALISLREYMYHPNSSINSAEAKVVRAAMDTYITQAKEVLKANEIKDVEAIKGLSKKHFVAEFMEGVFGSEIYYYEDHVDCGL